VAKRSGCCTLERFDADRVRQDLGIVAGASRDRFLIQSRQLAGQPLDARGRGSNLCGRCWNRTKPPGVPVDQSRAYHQVLELFNGRGIGSQYPGVMGTR